MLSNKKTVRGKLNEQTNGNLCINYCGTICDGSECIHPRRVEIDIEKLKNPKYCTNGNKCIYCDFIKQNKIVERINVMPKVEEIKCGVICILCGLNIYKHSGFSKYYKDKAICYENEHFDKLVTFNLDKNPNKVKINRFVLFQYSKNDNHKIYDYRVKMKFLCKYLPHFTKGMTIGFITEPRARMSVYGYNEKVTF